MNTWDLASALPLWDHVFGTMFDLKKKEDKRNKGLMFAPSEPTKQLQNIDWITFSSSLTVSSR